MDAENRTHQDSPTVSNVSPLPSDLVKTKQFQDALKYTRVTEIRGMRGSGKSYLSQYLSNNELKRLGNRAGVVWNFNGSTLAQLQEELLAMLNKLKAKLYLQGFQSSETGFVGQLCNLINYLNGQKMHCIIIFSGVKEEIKSEVKQVLECVLRQPHHSTDKIATDVVGPTECKAIVVIQDGCKVFTDIEKKKDNPENVTEFLLDGFEIVESVQYLKGHGKLDEGADELASCLGGHPVFLKAAWNYCADKKISYKELACEIEVDPKMVLQGFCKVLDAKNLESIEILQDLLEGGINPKFMATLEKLCLLGTEDIPIRVLSKMCDQTSNSSDLKHNWNEFIEKVGNCIPIKTVEIGEEMKYISIAKFFACYVLQWMKKDEQKVGGQLLRVMEVLTSLFSRDNRMWLDDGHLADTNTHISVFMKHALDHLTVSFNMKNQAEDDFFIWMGMCKLHALLGQAYVQSRKTKDWSKALDMLLAGAKLIWDVVDSYSRTGVLGFCFSGNDDDIWEYEANKSAKQVAKKIVKHCIEAGKKIKTSMVERYMRSNIKISKPAFDDFVDNVARTEQISIKEAEKQLQDIWDTVKEEKNLNDNQIDRLRKTGNMLAVEEYKKVFLAERLCDFFHTYGRQDLYAWKQMQSTKDQLEKCKFYTELSHHVAKQVRNKTGISVLYEFITVSNCKIPRSLQNRDKQEIDENRLLRLNEAYDLAKNMLTDKKIYHENGMYMATYHSTYTKLNAQKYLVKAANKMLKSGHNYPKDAVASCESMVSLAKDQVYLDMGPACLIMAAKFYASIGDFKRSFEVFEDGFKMNKDGKEYGIFQHYEGRPNTFAWAVYNYTRAVKAGIEKSYPVSVERALRRCKQVLEKQNDPNLDRKWIEVMSDYIAFLENYNMN